MSQIERPVTEKVGIVSAYCSEMVQEFPRLLEPLINPLSQDPLLGERLEKIIRKMKESGCCQRGLRVLELHWGNERLSYRKIGEVIGEEEGRGPYQGEIMSQVETDARHKIGHFIRSGRLLDNSDE